MRKSFMAARFAAAASVCVLAACAGGGGGGGPATTVIPAATSGTSTSSGSSSGTGTSSSGTSTSSSGTGTSSGSSDTGTSVVSNFGATLGSGSTDTNLFGIFTTGSIAITPKAGTVPVIAAPAAATTGTNSTPAPTGALPLNGTAFPLKQSVISITSGGIAPDAAANGGGATLSVLNWNASGDSQFRLTIPGLGVDATFTSASLLKGPSTVNGGTFRWTSSNMSYATLGLWEVDTTSTVAGVTEGNVHLAAFASGYETSAAGVPTSGTATYSGTQNVAGIVTSFPSSGGIARASLIGNASLSANFGTRSITGSFTNMVATSAGSLLTPWNDVSVSASLTAGTSHFSGSTAATSAPSVPFAMSGTATGRIDGGFYGPAANELGAVWSLKDNMGVAIGVVHGAPLP